MKLADQIPCVPTAVGGWWQNKDHSQWGTSTKEPTCSPALSGGIVRAQLPDSTPAAEPQHPCSARLGDDMSLLAVP